MGDKTGAALNRGGSKQDIGTPPEFIEATERRFGKIVFDLAAHQDNAVCADYYGPGSSRGENSLIVPWTLGGKARSGTLYLNPPFGHIEPWAQKCSTLWERSGFLLLLVPSARGSNWFQQHVKPFAYVIDLTDRIKFVGQSHGYPKDLILAVYGYGIVGENAWHWNSSVTKAYERVSKKTRQLQAAQAAE